MSPLPLASAAWRKGALRAVPALVAAVAVIAAAAGTTGMAMYLSQFGLGGYLLGLAVRQGRSPEGVVGAYAGVAVVGFWLLLGVVALQSGTTPATLLTNTVKQAADQAKELLLRADRSAEEVEAVRVWTEQTSRVFTRSFPGIVAAVSLLVGWANAIGLRRILARRGIPSEAWNTWRIGEYWIWLLIGSGLLALLGRGTAAAVGMNCFIPVCAVYFLQGLAIVQHLFETKHFPGLVRAVTYALLFFQLPVMLLVAGVGAFDLWIDFRSRWSPPPPTSAET